MVNKPSLFCAKLFFTPDNAGLATVTALFAEDAFSVAVHDKKTQNKRGVGNVNPYIAHDSEYCKGCQPHK